jgi:hypothetical protein
MSWTYEGFRIFWDDRGDAVDTVCELCYRGIPIEDLMPSHVNTYLTINMEVDNPLHCDWCSRLLKHVLTRDGIDYVLEAMRNLIHDVDGKPRKILVDDYRIIDSSRLGRDLEQWYDGSPRYSLVLDWNEELQWYGLEGDDYDLAIEFVDRILELEGSFRYRFYWKKEAVANAVTRPIARALDRRYRQTQREIEEFQG